MCMYSQCVKYWRIGINCLTSFITILLLRNAMSCNPCRRVGTNYYKDTHNLVVTKFVVWTKLQLLLHPSTWSFKITELTQLIYQRHLQPFPRYWVCWSFTQFTVITFRPLPLMAYCNCCPLSFASFSLLLHPPIRSRQFLPFTILSQA